MVIGLKVDKFGQDYGVPRLPKLTAGFDTLIQMQDTFFIHCMLLQHIIHLYYYVYLFWGKYKDNILYR